MPIINQIVKGGGTTPTGTLPITSNGIYDVTNYANADVQVPTTAPARYLEYEVDSSGTLKHSTTASNVMNFAGVTSIYTYALYQAYYDNTSISGTVDMSSVRTIENTGCHSMFLRCTGITGVDLSSLGAIQNAGCQWMFNGCTGLTSIDLSSVYSVDSSGCNGMFQDCTNLTSINLKLVSSGGYGALQNMFKGCTGLTSVDLSSFVSLIGNLVCSSMFEGCTNLASANISHIAKLGSNSQLQNMFKNCTSLTGLRFSGLPYTATNINSAFNNMLSGVTGCTVHFPAEWATPMANYSNITNGMGGTNTTVLFDLPNVTTLDLSHMTKIRYREFYEFAQNNYFPNVTSIDLSSVTTIDTNGCFSAFSGCSNLTSADLSSLETVVDYGCYNMFKGCTGLTSVDLSALTTISGANACSAMFSGCTGLTSVSLPALTTINGSNACNAMFQGCTGLTSVSLPALTTITGGQSCLYAFRNSTSLTTVYIGGTTAIDFGSDVYAFNYMFSGCTQNIDVYAPAASQTAIESLVGYPTFGSTGTVTWHWRS